MGGGGGRESLEVRDEEGRVGKGGVLSCQPDLVAAIPSQRVVEKRDLFMSCFMNVCSVVSVDSFLLLTKPVELTSKQFTVHDI